jgi:hypothetical protein
MGCCCNSTPLFRETITTQAEKETTRISTKLCFLVAKNQDAES